MNRLRSTGRALLAAAAAAIFSTAGGAADPGNAPLPRPRLWFRFTPGAGAGNRVRDDSGNGHDGRFESRRGALAAHIVKTPYGPALQLAKGEGVRVPLTPDLAAVKALTVMAWVRPDDVNRHLAVVAMKGDRNPGRPETGYRLSVAWRTAFAELGFGKSGGVRISAPPFSIEAKRWAHLALTFDGRDLILYIDAAEAARRHFQKPRRIQPFSSSDFTVGKYFWHDAYPFAGQLADVRIYDRALTPEQVFRAAAQWLGPP